MPLPTLVRLIGAHVLMLAIGACGGTPSLAKIDTAQQLWTATGPDSYRLEVEVDREQDRRRYRVTVSQGRIVAASLIYWEQQPKVWGAPQELNATQAEIGTVAGLFDVIRRVLQSAGGRPVSVSLDGEPPFPRRIVLGLVRGDRQVPGSGATISVISYQPSL